MSLESEMGKREKKVFARPYMDLALLWVLSDKRPFEGLKEKGPKPTNSKETFIFFFCGTAVNEANGAINEAYKKRKVYSWD